MIIPRFCGLVRGGALDRFTGIRPEIRFGLSRIGATDSARVLGATVTIDPMLGWQVTVTCAQRICQLRQLRTVRISLDEYAAATLARILVASRVDYCSCPLAASSKQLTDKIQRLMNVYSGPSGHRRTEVWTRLDTIAACMTNCMTNCICWMSLSETNSGLPLSS